jgi:predicted hydrocarbon binding protein
MEERLEEKRIPSFLLNLLLNQVNEMLGRRSLIMLLRQAGLAGYIDNLPLRNGSPSITVDQYSHLLASIYDTFGPQDARFILLNGGRLAAVEFRRQHTARYALARTALKVLAADTRMRLVLEKLAEQSQDLFGTPHYLDENEDAFVAELPACPHCAEINQHTVATDQPADKPVCHIPLAIIDEMVEWGTGERHLVEEVACIAMGDPACRFRVAR